jgi:predicted metal-dependent enzyme (double-stranded beta helix superfamily)
MTKQINFAAFWHCDRPRRAERNPMTTLAPEVTALLRPLSGTTPSTRVPPLPAHVLGDIARGIADAVPLWSAVVRHDPDGRLPVRLLATDRYEVWVIGWTTGQNVRLHDHGDAAGAFVVADGELTEVLPTGEGGAVERTLSSGRLRHLAVGMVHDVVNRAEARATSVHVYSPPIATMTYYDADTLDPVATEPVAPEPTVLGPGAASYVLHSSHGRSTPR